VASPLSGCGFSLAGSHRLAFPSPGAIPRFSDKIETRHSANPAAKPAIEQLTLGDPACTWLSRAGHAGAAQHVPAGM